MCKTHKWTTFARDLQGHHILMHATVVTATVVTTLKAALEIEMSISSMDIQMFN